MSGKAKPSSGKRSQRSPKPLTPSLKTGNCMTARMDEAIRAHWLSRGAWTKRELIDLLCGLPPDRARPSSDETNLAGEEIRRAVEMHELEPRPRAQATAADSFYDNHQLFKPNEAIKWATSSPGRFPHFPFTLEDIAPDHNVDLPLNKRERASLHLIIAALANLANVDLAHPYKAANQVLSAMGKLPASPALTSNCVGDHLKRASATANLGEETRKQA